MTEQNRNLALRLLSALVLAPTLVFISWKGGLPFALMCAVASAIAARELVAMLTPIGKAELFAIGLAGLVPLAPWWARLHAGGAYPEWMLVALGFAAMVLLAATLFREGGALEGAPARASAASLAWLYCGVLCASVVALRLRFGFGWVVMAFVVTWLNDTFAYFAGRFLGRNKMFPRISPKKTWEGFAGGVAGSIGGALLLLAIFPAAWLPGLTAGGCFLLGAGGAIVGPVGDLVESMLKRAAGVKDSGKLIPGHGGLLDRIDALLFVAPWVYVFAAVAG
jgi:phosphatidate cytidylyltransferase